MNTNKRFSIYSKQGINLITLVITIVVSLILVTIGITTVSDSISDATLTAFADDLSIIQDQTNLYYLQNDAFPTPSEASDALSQNSVLEIVDNDSKFTEELKLNNDYNDNGELGEFYKIDMVKLNIEKTVRGTMADGDTSDIYVVSARTMNIYYLKGIEVEDEMYYSLSSKIIKYVKTVTPTEDNMDETSIQTVGSLTAKIANKDWTNKLGITLNAYMNDGESLYLSIPDVEEKLVTTLVGNNTFIFNSFADIQAKVSTLTEEDITTLNSKQGSSKYIEFVKRNSTTEIDRLKIDLSNCDIVSPSYSEKKIVENEQENVLTFEVSDAESGIKQVRYDYLKKYNEVGEQENFYEGVEELTTSYIKQKGKKATISNSENEKAKNVEIRLPKDISQIQILILDNAGNWTSINTSIPSSFYIGTALNTINENGALFRVTFNSNLGVSNYSVSVSTDNGTTYSSAIAKTANTTNQSYYQFISDYKTGLSITNNLYIKIVATDNNTTVADRVTKIRIVRYSLEDNNTLSYVENTNISVVDGVIIPKGFVASSATGENTKSGGLVIYEGTEPVTDKNVSTARTTRNQFVWVPIDNLNELVRYDFRKDTELATNYIEPNVSNTQEQEEYDAMISSIKTYRGFYIARYEAGIDSGYIPNSTTLNKADSKKGRIVYNQIGWSNVNDMTTQTGGAVEVSRAMYPDNEEKTTGDVVSTLVYGIQWDATVRWLKNSGYDVQDSSTYGNYSNYNDSVSSDKQNIGAGTLQNTGIDENWKANNIYDLAGNLQEWTMEYNGTDRVFRGGYYSSSGNGTPVSYRDAIGGPACKYNFIGFRPALYIKE